MHNLPKLCIAEVHVPATDCTYDNYYLLKVLSYVDKDSQHSFMLVLAACVIVQQIATGLASHRTVHCSSKCKCALSTCG